MWGGDGKLVEHARNQFGTTAVAPARALLAIPITAEPLRMCAKKLAHFDINNCSTNGKEGAAGNCYKHHRTHGEVTRTIPTVCQLP